MSKQEEVAGKVASELAAGAMASIHEGAGIMDRITELIEFGKGVFVTTAMLNRVRESKFFPGAVARERSCMEPFIFPGMEVARPEPSQEMPTLTEVVERLDQLERLIKFIFDGHVLIDGRFRKITP